MSSTIERNVAMIKQFWIDLYNHDFAKVGTYFTADAEYDDVRDINSIVDTNLSNQIGYYFVTKVKLHLHAGDWSGALEWAALLAMRLIQPAQQRVIFINNKGELEHAMSSASRSRALALQPTTCFVYQQLHCFAFSRP